MRWRKFLFLAVVCSSAAVGELLVSHEFPEIVARVNDVAITRAQFEVRIAQSRSMNPVLFDAMGAEEKTRAIVRVLNGMIQRELEVQEAHRQGMAIPESEVERRLAELETAYANKGGLKQALADFQITLEQWKKETRENFLIEKLEASQYRRIPVSDEEIREKFRNFWKETQPPSPKDLDEHREHMRFVVQQRQWTLRRRKEWMRSLADAAQIWRWTPAPGAETNKPSRVIPSGHLKRRLLP